MSIKTNLGGRLRNTSLPLSHGLMPLFDAVVNSIHSIEEKDELSGSDSPSDIVVEIERRSQGTLGIGTSDDNPEEIIGFKVTDTGIGFNEENMESFETLDTEHKVDKGCRGVGRLLWLKAFVRVDVRSTYSNGNELRSREFSFDATSGVSDHKEEPAGNDKRSTTVHLVGFDKKYAGKVPKRPEDISRHLLEHCLWYFVRKGGAPVIIVKDGAEKISLDGLYEEYMHSSAKTEEIDVKEQKFSITHIKFHASVARKAHMLSFCAARRLVKEEKLNDKIPGLYGKITDNDGEFVYSCYVNSAYLDERARSERTGFDIEENVEGLFASEEISLQDIRDGIFPKIKGFLSEPLQVNIEAGKSRVEEFVARQAPKYRPILGRIPADRLIVDPNISNKDLEIHLHRDLAEIERDLLEKGQNIMNPLSGENTESYHRRIKDYLEEVSDVRKSNLANYVCHRKVIIDLLEKALEKNSDGKYVNENVIHEFIMPMRKDSNDVFPENCNLWLLDERLVFHDYLASDKPIKSMPISNSKEANEPDILALNFYDQPILVSEKQTPPLASITVVEIKKPMRNDASAGEKRNPIEQTLGYLDRIRQGGVKTPQGRPIPNSNDLPGYCYVVCDLTKSIIHTCKNFDLTETSDHLGYFGFHKTYKSYIEVVSFDRLVNSAKERNQAFFDKLGLPVENNQGRG